MCVAFVLASVSPSAQPPVHPCRPQQALHDAEHALALRPDWPKAWGRKAAALLQLGQPAAAAEAYQKALQLEQGQGEASGGSGALREGLRQAQAALAKQHRAPQPAKQPQPQPQPSKQQKPLQQPQQPPQHRPRAPNGLKAGPASTAPPPPVHASSVAAAPPQQSASVVAEPINSSPASSAPGLQQQPRPQVPGLLAAWQALQLQAAEAAAALAQLQQQMQAFEGLLLAAHQPAGEAPQEAPVADHETSAAGLAAQDSSVPVAEASEEAPAAGAAAVAGSVPSPDTAAPLEASRQPGSPSSGLSSSFDSLSSLPGSPAEATAAVAGEAGSPAGRGWRSAQDDVCGCGGGSSTSSSESDSDSEVEEVYSEVPVAAAAAAAEGTLRSSAAGSAAEAEAAAVPAAAPVCSGASITADGSSHGKSSAASSRRGSSPTDRTAGKPTNGSDSSDDEEGSHSSDELSHSSDDDAWLASVEAARRRLVAEGARMTPPAKAGRRAPQPAKVAAAADGGLASLRQMCADAEAAAMAVDASGTPRAACKQCGDSLCPRFRPAGAQSEAQLAAALAQQAAADAGFTKPDACTCCGCPSSAHETPREFATRQARERRQRLRAQRQASGTAAGSGSAAAAASTKDAPFQPESQEDRQRRVAAAAQRRAEAEAAGDLLQDSDCDMLTQQRRTTCGGCSSCPGFRLTFRWGWAGVLRGGFMALVGRLCGLRPQMLEHGVSWLMCICTGALLLPLPSHP